MLQVHHRTAQVEGYDVFYREAGPADAPVLVLLHGYPTSSFMYRHLIPLLAGRYRVIAPDHLGFGFSDAPPAEEFSYTFDSLAEVTAGLLAQLGVSRFAIVVQDYGAPVGWRLALRDDLQVTAVVTQNGNAYEEGFAPGFWDPLWAYAAQPGPTTEAPVRAALEEEAVRWQYTHGLSQPDLVSPDTWTHDLALLARPGNDQVQLALFRDYVTNRALYPRLHEWLRAQRLPLLAVWGRNDEIFLPEGARAFARDLPDAEVHLLDAGHFALESHLHEIAPIVLDFLHRRAV